VWAREPVLRSRQRAGSMKAEGTVPVNGSIGKRKVGKLFSCLKTGQNYNLMTQPGEKLSLPCLSIDRELRRNGSVMSAGCKQAVLAPHLAKIYFIQKEPTSNDRLAKIPICQPPA
jgi:hypothetical protein